jgi:hypothetical protein
MSEISTHLQFVAAPRCFAGKFVDRQQLKLIGGPPPSVEKVAAPPFGGNQHVLWSLAVCVAVKTGVAKNRAQQRAGDELVAIGGPNRCAPLPFVGRRSFGE